MGHRLQDSIVKLNGAGDQQGGVRGLRRHGGGCLFGGLQEDGWRGRFIDLNVNVVWGKSVSLR